MRSQRDSQLKNIRTKRRQSTNDENDNKSNEDNSNEVDRKKRTDSETDASPSLKFVMHNERQPKLDTHLSKLQKIASCIYNYISMQKQPLNGIKLNLPSCAKHDFISISKQVKMCKFM